jgi:hypothetical protein
VAGRQPALDVEHEARLLASGDQAVPPRVGEREARHPVAVGDAVDPGRAEPDDDLRRRAVL